MSAPETVLLGGDDASPALARQAPAFAPLLERFGPATVEAGRAVFPALVEAICNQQLSVQAGATVYGRVEACCNGHPTAEAILEASGDALREAGLSRPKVGYVRDLATRVRDGALDLENLEDMDDDAVRQMLTQVKGIGAWTANMVLIFTLHRPDVLPAGDLGVRDGARLVLGLDERPGEPELREIGEAWSPYRSVASWYLWRERDRILREDGKR